MHILMVTSKVKEEYVADAQAVIDKLFQALEREQLAVRYAVTKLSDGVTFIAFLEFEPDQEHPLRTLPEYTEVVESFEKWRAEPATVEHMPVIGSHRLF